MVYAMNDTDAAIGFSAFPGIGPMRYGVLVSAFGSPKAVWEASVSRLRETGLHESLCSSFERFRYSFSIDVYKEQLTRFSVTPLPIFDPRYPASLRAISDPPIVLYVRGKKKGNLIDFSKSVGVVGTRMPTPYGREMTRRIVSVLVDAGCPIISGMAMGIDAIAHQQALDMGGQTVAVLGCGVDIIAPVTNERIYTALVAGGHGAVVSEMPLSHKPSKGIFPARNRIISGMAACCVIIEGTKKSGSLITARYAAEQGRDVFALPGPANSPYSEGPNELIKNGANVATTGYEILDFLHISRNASSRGQSKNLEGTQKRIVEYLLLRGPQSLDTLATALLIPPSQILSDLSILEIRGIIRDHGGKVYGITQISP